MANRQLHELTLDTTVEAGDFFYKVPSDNATSQEPRKTRIEDIGQYIVDNQLGGGEGVVTEAADSNTTYATLTSVTPFDTSVPTSSEGTEILSVTMTPKYASSNINIYFSISLSVASAHVIIGALFIDSDTSATRTFAVTPGNNHVTTFTGVFRLATNNTNSRTYRLRIGSELSRSIYLNGRGGASRLGGSLHTQMLCQEVST